MAHNPLEQEKELKRSIRVRRFFKSSFIQLHPFSWYASFGFSSFVRFRKTSLWRKNR